MVIYLQCSLTLDRDYFAYLVTVTHPGPTTDGGGIAPGWQGFFFVAGIIKGVILVSLYTYVSCDYWSNRLI